ADIHVVSKCDKSDASRTIADLKNMLALGFGTGEAVLQPPVIATSSVRDEGIAELAEAIDRHYTMLVDSGGIAVRRTQIDKRRLLTASEAILRDRVVRHGEDRVSALLEALARRELSPHSAALRLLAALPSGETI